MKLSVVNFQIMFMFINLFLNSGLATLSFNKNTHVNYMLEAFNPYSVIRFFEFSDKGWNISENCLKNMYNYLEGLKSGALWAVKCKSKLSFSLKKSETKQHLHLRLGRMKKYAIEEA